MLLKRSLGICIGACGLSLLLSTIDVCDVSAKFRASFFSSAWLVEIHSIGKMDILVLSKHPVFRCCVLLSHAAG